LKEKFNQKIEEFKDFKTIPRPPFWGGYVMKPKMIEFWKGRSIGWLHDRIEFRLQDDLWSHKRL
jgi:pyridoxamine 5'-phosphate oxidase